MLLLVLACEIERSFKSTIVSYVNLFFYKAGSSPSSFSESFSILTWLFFNPFSLIESYFLPMFKREGGDLGDSIEHWVCCSSLEVMLDREPSFTLTINEVFIPFSFGKGEVDWSFSSTLLVMMYGVFPFL